MHFRQGAGECKGESGEWGSFTHRRQAILIYTPVIPRYFSCLRFWRVAVSVALSFAVQNRPCGEVAERLKALAWKAGIL